MCKIFVIEGLDGAGKSTQIELLSHYFNKTSISFKFKHFPDMKSPFFGDLVARFLRGDFGQAKDVDPYLVAMLYAGDRFNALNFLNDNNTNVILLDRYVYSNIAFQCAKIKDTEKKELLKNWIFDLEFDYFKLPKPTKSIFLNVPFEFTKEQLTKIRLGNDREYLKGFQDIHENNFNLQENVLSEYLKFSKQDRNFIELNCVDSNNNMLPKEDIHKKILEIIISEL